MSSKTKTLKIKWPRYFCFDFTFYLIKQQLDFVIISVEIHLNYEIEILFFSFIFLIQVYILIREDFPNQAPTLLLDCNSSLNFGDYYEIIYRKFRHYLKLSLSLLNVTSINSILFHPIPPNHALSAKYLTVPWSPMNEQIAFNFHRFPNYFRLKKSDSHFNVHDRPSWTYHYRHSVVILIIGFNLNAVTGSIMNSNLIDTMNYAASFIGLFHLRICPCNLIWQMKSSYLCQTALTTYPVPISPLDCFQNSAVNSSSDHFCCQFPAQIRQQDPFQHCFCFAQ